MIQEKMQHLRELRDSNLHHLNTSRRLLVNIRRARWLSVKNNDQLRGWKKNPFQHKPAQKTAHQYYWEITHTHTCWECVFDYTLLSYFIIPRSGTFKVSRPALVLTKCSERFRPHWVYPHGKRQGSRGHTRTLTHADHAHRFQTSFL